MRAHHCFQHFYDTAFKKLTRHHRFLVANFSKLSLTERETRLKEAIKTINFMSSKGVALSYATYDRLLQACIDTESLVHGLELHKHLISRAPTKLSFHINVKLMRLYAVCGEMDKVRQVFDEIPQPDARCWGLMIKVYNMHGYPNESLCLYSKLKRRQDTVLDKYILLDVAKACSVLSDLTKAKEIHNDANRLGLESDLLVANALINLYGKCGSMDDVVLVFNKMCHRDVISWTSMIVGFVRCGCWEKALQVLSEMVSVGERPNSVTISSVLLACSSLPGLPLGEMIHGYAIRVGVEENAFVSAALINMYAKCLDIFHARQVFDMVPQRDVVSWNVICAAYLQNGEVEKAIELFEEMKCTGVIPNVASWNAVISGCAQNGEAMAAIELFQRMNREGFKPDKITIASILPTFSSLEYLRSGEELHCYCVRRSLIDDTIVATALLNMYAVCGSLNISLKVFNEMRERDTISWNVVISAYAVHGHGEKALAFFQKMQKAGIKPNAATFAGVLSACSHAGLVEEGRHFFQSMSKDHGLMPDTDHYACMVDILSRSGFLDEAYKFILIMPVKATASSWGSLLGGCRMYKNVELGRIAAEHLFQIEPDNPGNYILLANIYVALGMWEDAVSLRKLMRDKCIEKTPGCSWVQVRGRIYTFVSGDRSHAQSDRIYEFLAELSRAMKVAGYLPDTRFALADVDSEDKELVLGFHSEKLAAAFAFLNMESASSVCIFKNLRICGDCHDVMKFLSSIMTTKITVRDSMRFHHFSNGFCSCHDFW